VKNRIRFFKKTEIRSQPHIANSQVLPKNPPMGISFFLPAILGLVIFIPVAGFSQTQVLKWQDGKEGCVTLTYDDGSANQFRIAVPLMNERGLPATFFVNTGNIPGAKYKPTFVGRPLQEIIRECEAVPTDKNNFFERCSALRYLAQVRDDPQAKGFSDATVGEMIEQGKAEEAFSTVDKFMRRLRESGHEYKVETTAYQANKSCELTWNQLRTLAGQGYEIANHTISHPYLPVLDKANILYEVEKCREDILSHLGPMHTYSIECPYGIEDARVLAMVNPLFPFVRNGIADKFIREILRGDPSEPTSAGKEYVQWQRGPLANTPIAEMEGWIEKTINKNAWLLLVFHGIEGVGWEALSKETIAVYFDYIKDRNAHLWTATFQDAFKYVRERMNAKMEFISNPDSITVFLSHGLDRRIYNLPLTLQTVVPAAWKRADLQQGARKTNLIVQRRGEIAFVQYRAVPNSAKIILSKKE
jgi:peptidoglycan/xylan/chitin deacetylase (PgdA/CDA1 family)